MCPEGGFVKINVITIGKLASYYKKVLKNPIVLIDGIKLKRLTLRYSIGCCNEDFFEWDRNGGSSA